MSQMVELAVLEPKAHRNEDMRLFSFLDELAEPLKNVAFTAWNARGKLLRDTRTYVVFVTSSAASMPERTIRVLRNPKLHRFLREDEDPEALGAVLAAGGGALCVGSAGAVIGAAAGGTVGTAMGAVPALFTFGLSLPIGAVVGGSTGVCVGSAAGGSAGLLGGAVTGFVVAHYRVQIVNGATTVVLTVGNVYDKLIIQPSIKVQSTAAFTKKHAKKAGSRAKAIASDRHIQSAAVGAAVGAASLGTAGAVGGTLAGGTTGALIGLVFAPFTFGLSIPMGAAVGGGTGCCVGGAAGTSTGFVCGGSAGFFGSRALRRSADPASTGAAVTVEDLGEAELQKKSSSGSTD